MGELLTFTDGNFQKEVKESSVPVVVDFWAVWCAPCTMIAPIVEEIATEYGDRIKVGKLDVDSNQRTAAEFGIRSIPSLLIFKEGKVAEQIIGAVPKKEIVKKVESVLSPSA
ncbi:MAG: thioredoxin [bacterium]